MQNGWPILGSLEKRLSSWATWCSSRGSEEEEAEQGREEWGVGVEKQTGEGMGSSWVQRLPFHYLLSEKLATIGLTALLHI